MKQQLLTKQMPVLITEDITLKDVLSNAMKQVGIFPKVDIDQALEQVAKYLIFHVDGVMVKKLDTIIKQGATVKLLPALKAG